jgi:hypothetical protein
VPSRAHVGRARRALGTVSLPAEEFAALEACVRRPAA